MKKYEDYCSNLVDPFLKNIRNSSENDAKFEEAIKNVDSNADIFDSLDMTLSRFKNATNVLNYKSANDTEYIKRISVILDLYHSEDK